MTLSLRSPKRSSQRPSGPCAECRKHKLRCQGTYPCQNCVDQGRAEACLQGSTVKGTRSVKPSQIELHETMTMMSRRQQTLEQALAELQSSISSEPHPLLVTDSRIRTASPVPNLLHGNESEPQDDQPPDASVDGLAEALGVMSIKHDGKTQYHGDTATSEYLVKDSYEGEGQESPNDPPARRRPPPLRLPPELVLLSALFPCPPKDHEPPDMNVFLDCLPPYERASTLLQYYFSYFSWCSMVINKSETMDGIFDPIYPNGKKVTSLRLSDAHRLGVLFTIFLLGTLYDLELGTEDLAREAEEFHSLARAAIAAVPVADHPTVQGVQAIVLIIWYFRLYPGRRAPSYQWALSGVLTKLVVAAGLHRDCSAYLKKPSERVLFEQTFWEYHSVDIWQSFNFGRPTSMASGQIDCKRPYYVDVPSGHDPDFYLWKYSFTQLVSDVVGQTMTATYEDILRYGKKLKNHYTPDSLTWPPRGEPLPTDEPVGKTFQRYIMTVFKNVSIMYIHRRWLVETIIKHQDDPSKSRSWQSVVAAYESAATLTDDMRRLWLVYPRLIDRMAPFWSHTQTAALLLCALVTHIPRCDFTPEALRHVDETCQMFADAKESLQPSNALASLRKHQRQAHYAFDKSHNMHARPVLSMKDEEMSLSPSDTQFPFVFGDSPLYIRGQSVYDNGSSGFGASASPVSPTSSDRIVSPYAVVAETLGLSPSSDGPGVAVLPHRSGSFSGLEEYGVPNEWPNFMMQMSVRP